MEQNPRFAIGLGPEVRAYMEDLVERGFDWRVALLQSTVKFEPVFVDLLDDEPEQPEETTIEQISPELN